MHKPFEMLASLIDEFWQQYDYPVKPGAKPQYYDDYYLKLYWFGILERCPEKSRFLERALRSFPAIFKKSLALPPFYDA